jgi:nucleotide-binding universal stress UspA family protein
MSSPARIAVSPQLKNILFATDFSRCSASALESACAIARCYGSTVHVVHVLAPDQVCAGALDDEREHAHAKMTRFLHSHRPNDVSHHVRIHGGPVADTLTQLVREQDIDLIALGTHGHDGRKEAQLGSIAGEILRRAPCPVLTVSQGSEPAQPAGDKLKRILYATDFSPASFGALPYALSLALRNQSRLLLLYVDTSEVTRDWLNEAAFEQRLTELMPHGVDQFCSIEPIVELGPPGEKIVSEAAANDVNLIVLGGRRRAGLHLVNEDKPWVTTSAVVANAQCPVLTVHS